MTSMPMRVVASRGRVVFSVRCTRSPSAALMHEVGERHPLVDPPAVGAAEHALRRARIADPALVVRRVGVLDALPRRERGGEHALEQRRRHALPAPGLLAHAQRGADRERGEVADAMLTHGTPEWSGPGPGRGDPAVVGHDEVGERGRDAGQAGERAAGDAAALPLVAGARRDQRVDRGTVGVRAVVAVRGDRAVHEARVAREQRVVVEAERAATPGREVLDQHVGVRRERDERVRGRPRRARSRTALRLPRCHTCAPLNARVGSPPGGSILVTCAPWSASSMPVTGPAIPVREVEHGQAVEHTRHVPGTGPPFGRRRGWRTPASEPRGRRGSTGT